MTAPTISVRAAFTASAKDVMTEQSVTWTDITPAVLAGDGLNLKRGRTTHSDAVSTGLGSFTLDNTSGDFTPENTGGAYHPLRLRVPVQVRRAVSASYNPDAVYDVASNYDSALAGEIPFWTGTVDSWGAGWVSGPTGRTRVTAGDMVSHCARTKLEALPVQASLAASPTWLYPLDESSATVLAADRVGNPNAPTLEQTRLGVSGSPTADFGQGYSPGSQPDSAESTVLTLVPHDATNGYYLLGTNVPAIATTLSGSTLHAMVLPSATSRVQTAVRFVDADSNVINFGLDATGKATAYNSKTASTITGSSTVGTADWSHIAVEQSYSGGTTTLKLWVNGTNEASTSWTGDVIGATAGTLHVGMGDSTATWDGNLCNVAAHTTALGSNTISEIADGRDGWDGDGTVTRLYRIARAAGLSAYTPTGDMQVTGMTLMGAQSTRDKSASQAFDDCANAEGAPWWVDAGGLIQMTTRYFRNAAVLSSEFTIPGSKLDPGTSFTMDDSLLVNLVKATRPGGAEALTRKDTDSIARYGEYSTSVDLYLRNDTDLAAFAEAIAFLDSEPVARSGSITVDLFNNPSDLDKILEADVGALFTVNALPAEAPASSLDLFFEGVADVITANNWRRTINTSRGSRYSAWILGSADLDTTTVLGY